MDKNAPKNSISWNTIPDEVKDKEVYDLSDDMTDEEVKSCIAAITQGIPLNEVDI